MLRDPQRLKAWLTVAAFSLPLAWLARLAGLPAAFLLGPMVGAIAYGLSGKVPLQVPRPLFAAVQALLGCAIARSITGTFLDTMKVNGPLLLLVVSVTILSGAFVGWVLIRYGALPGTTAAWGSSPGGASAMVAMAEDFGADSRLVAFMQYTRVVLVVVTATVISRVLMGAGPAGSGALPPLFTTTPLAPTLTTLAIAAGGGLLGRLSGIPAGALLVPMILGGALHALGLDLVVPPWLLAAANLVLGWQVGLGFDRDLLRDMLRAIPQLLASTVLLILLCAGSSWALTRVLPLDPLTAYLATSPGGLDSIAIIALGSGVDLSFVMAVQTLRLFLVILVGPRIARWLCRFART